MKSTILSKEEAKELLIKAKKGDTKAKELLLIYNMGLIRTISANYQGNGLELEDLMIEGGLGLIRAIDAYDLSKDTNFPTYAFYWIRQYLNKAIRTQGKLIKLPNYIFVRVKKLTILKSKLEKELGHTPTIEELALYMNTTIDDINNLEKSMRSVISLNMPIPYYNTENELQELVADLDTDVFLQMFDKIKSDGIKRIIENSGLTEREIKILFMRFGIDEEEKSLSEIANIYNLSIERVRQIEKKIFKVLRDPIILDKLKDYLEEDVNFENYSKCLKKI